MERFETRCDYDLRGPVNDLLFMQEKYGGRVTEGEGEGDEGDASEEETEEGKASKRDEGAIVDVRRGREFTLANRPATRERKIGDGGGARAHAPRGCPRYFIKSLKSPRRAWRPRTHHSPLPFFPLLPLPLYRAASVSRESGE